MRPGAASADGKLARRKESWKETLRFWAVSLAVILLLRAFIFEPYRIPSESMEDTLLVGDFLVVSKLHYGARTPSTLGVPFTRIYLPGLQLPQTRLPGFSEVRRGDIAVFNYPAALDVVRGAIPASVPIERRDPYIKRIVALPGDTVAVVDKVVYLDGRPQALRPTQKQTWRVYGRGESQLSPAALAEMGAIFQGNVTAGGRPVSPVQYDVVATPAVARQIEQRMSVARVEPSYRPAGVQVSALVFPPGSDSNPDQFGPVVVPGAGQPYPLNAQTWPALRDVVTRYEGHEARLREDGRVEVDGRVAATYTPRQDYYLAMGDNRDNSVDGRYWGFVPADHLVGKATFIFISLRSILPPIPRFERFFRPIR